MTLHAPRSQQGFTLIEVMAAFAVFALLFGITLQILSVSLSNTRRAGDFTQAALWAQTQLDMVGIEEPIEPGRSHGRFNDTYDWQLEIEPWMVVDERGLDPESSSVNLYRVTLIVSWGEGQARREAVFDTLRSSDDHWEQRRLAR